MDASMPSLIQSHQESGSGTDNYVVLRANSELPKNTSVQVSLSAIPSAEGPNVGAATSYNFLTYGPMRLTTEDRHMTGEQEG